MDKAAAAAAGRAGGGLGPLPFGTTPPSSPLHNGIARECPGAQQGPAEHSHERFILLLAAERHREDRGLGIATWVRR